MSRICELTGKGRQVGHNVSHANNKTKRTFLPNLQNVTLISESLGRGVKLRVSMNGLRSVEHVGGLDNWLLKSKDDSLSLKARRLKREIAKKQQGEAAAPPDPSSRRRPGPQRDTASEGHPWAPAFAGDDSRSSFHQSELHQQGPLQRVVIVVRGDPQDRPAALPGHAQRLEIVAGHRALERGDLLARDQRAARSSPGRAAMVSLAVKPANRPTCRLSSTSLPSGSKAASVIR